MRSLERWVAILSLTFGLMLFPLRSTGGSTPGRDAGLTDLIASVKAKDGPSVSKLLHAGANPNSRDPKGLTPLHYAASDGDVTVAMLLLAAGADANAKDAQGLTPLHDAAANGSREIANVLLASGADPKAVSSAGLTPAGEAFRNHHQALADYLGARQVSPRPAQGPGQARAYTNDDLSAVRRSSRLANEEQLAQARPGASAPGDPAAGSSGTSPATSGQGKGALAKESRAQLQRAYDRGEWTEDIEAAQQFSKETQRPILALFTGSDWCHFCKLLESNVLSTDTFRERVKGKYILLYVDFPRHTVVPKDIIGQRTRLSEKYGVSGFPALVVPTDGDQVTGKIFGFRQGTTAEQYISGIEEIAPR